MESKRDIEEATDEPSLEASIHSDKEDRSSTIVYPSASRLALIITAIVISIFLVALDTTIISTAIPRITDDFHSLDDVAWYGSGFFMTMGAFQTMFGKMYKYASIKTVFLASIVIFELGSLICALAPTSTALIVGRAIAGVGGAGIGSGCYLITGISVRPEKVPALLGIIGASFALASVIGPLLGGVFTESLNWRWCFWINLPLGAVGALIILVFFSTPKHIVPVKATWKERMLQLDIPGTIMFLGAITCFLLALQWAGLSKSWSSSPVIGTLVGSALLFSIFIIIEAYSKERAVVNLRLLKNKTIGFLMVYQFFISGVFFVLLYYLPLYFQTVSGADARDSGIRTIPVVAAASILSIAAGAIMSTTKEFQLVMVAGCTLVTIGSGLVFTLDIDSPARSWIGFQVLVGVGLGFTNQVAVTASQCFAEPTDLSSLSAIALSMQLFGGTIWLAVGQSIFQNQLLLSLEQQPGIDAQGVLSAGASEVRKKLIGELLNEVIQSYMSGLRNGFGLCIGLGSMAYLVSILFLVFDRKRLR